MANAQTPKLDPETFLPPAPAWSGASEKLIAPAKDPWITPSEKTDLTATPSYDETIAWLKKVDKQSTFVRMEAFGTTPQGRKMMALVISKDGAALQPSKPVFLVQAGIHSGEIDGKEALRFNLAESPLSVLGRKRDKDGIAYLSAHLIEAGRIHPDRVVTLLFAVPSPHRARSTRLVRCTPPHGGLNDLLR